MGYLFDASVPLCKDHLSTETTIIEGPVSGPFIYAGFTVSSKYI